MQSPQHNPGSAVLVVHGVLLVMLAGLVIATPHAVERIAEAVQAEFVGPDAPVVAPTQFTQPGGRDSEALLRDPSPVIQGERLGRVISSY